MPVVARVFVLGALLLSGVQPSLAQAEGTIVAEHPSDYVRVLEMDQSEICEEAVIGLLGEDDELPELSVASVVRRLPSVGPKVQARVAVALGEHPFHRDTAETLWQLAHAPLEPDTEHAVGESRSDEEVAPPTEEASPREAILGLLGDPVETEPPNDAFAEVRRAARASLLSMRHDSYREYFRELILEGGEDRIEAMQALVDTFKDAPMDDFDTRYLPALIPLFQSPEASDRTAALKATWWLDSPGLRREWTFLLQDADEEIRERARSTLSDHGESSAEAEQGMPEESDEPQLTIAPWILVVSAVLSGIVGLLLFIWAFRLVQLAVRVRYRPTSSVRSVALGPVALEGEVQPAGRYLHHPLTGESCVYYAGADVDKPDARFYLEDGTGRVLVDPRRAVLFSDDDVLVAGERVHLVGFADRDSDGSIVIRKDQTSPPLYRCMVHGVIKALFGFGHATSVTRMLFSDPHRCFWIWDDLERRPMGEARDVLWLAGGFLLGGAWMVVFGLAVVGLIDEGTVSTLLQGF